MCTTCCNIVTFITISIVVISILIGESINFSNVCKINNYTNNAKKRYLYNSSKVFNIEGRFPETKTFTVLSPECMFSGNYTERDCKSYTSLFLDLDCTFNQKVNVTDHKGNPDYYLYLSPEFYYSYDSRLDIYDQIKHKSLRLPYSIVCQSNNVCLYIVQFTLSYKNWNNVPEHGNNITLNCKKFDVYVYINNLY